jgi:hypothetical protein|tara:strand:- start:1572 stop:2240 length:669 start_codon:yes stop_codon:yes gene_type:complete
MKVILALPGRTFSGTFLMNWSQTLLTLKKEGYDFAVINEFSSFVTFSRMKTLGLDVLRGTDQKPFGGKEEYDVWLTIDSDIVFTPEQVIELLEDTKKYPVVSGLYRMQDMKHYACVKEWDLDYFKKNGSFQFMKVGEPEKEDKYTPVAYNGMGFFACRKEVLEKLTYPYFSYPLIEIEAEDGKILRDMCSEDVAFCKNVIDAGFDIVVNTDLIVGHEKTLVI